MRVLSLIAIVLLTACEQFSFVGSGRLHHSPEVQIRVPGDRPALSCETAQSSIVKAGESILLSWTNIDADSAGLSFGIESDSLANKGSIVAGAPWTGTYTASPEVSNELTVRIYANLPGRASGLPCVVHVIPKGDIGIKDDGNTRGLVGKVYELEEGIPYLPDFSLRTPVQSIVVANLDIPTRNFTEGFPGVRELEEWFGIRFDGKLKVPATGDYDFLLFSDDGSILRIDGEIVVNNDGIHSPVPEYGYHVQLTEGYHTIQVDYYQGPRHQIALQLLWRPAGPVNSDEGFVVIGADSFERP